MKIVQYCQHVLGIGHLVRTIEILRELKAHEIILINGGIPLEYPLPVNVEEFRLPVLMMDPEFKGLQSQEPGVSVDEIKAMRQRLLFDLFAGAKPDVFLVELFPFGRRQFAFEIVPILEEIRKGTFSQPLVVCSLRDILVERGKKTDKYEQEVTGRLNRYFDVLMVHSDPDLLRLDDTFARTGSINIPLVYTGYVAQRPAAGARAVMRQRLGIHADDRLVIASAGGGRVGAELLYAVLAAFEQMPPKPAAHLIVFSGPHMLEGEFKRLMENCSANIRIERFTTEFLSHLAAADLSISMAGYNTCMNIVATRIPALVWPFAVNREQRMRAQRLARLGALTILDEQDLKPTRLASLMTRNLQGQYQQSLPLNIDGAANTANWITQRVGKS